MISGCNTHVTHQLVILFICSWGVHKRPPNVHRITHGVPSAAIIVLLAWAHEHPPISTTHTSDCCSVLKTNVTRARKRAAGKSTGERKDYTYHTYVRTCSQGCCAQGVERKNSCNNDYQYCCTYEIYVHMYLVHRPVYTKHDVIPVELKTKRDYG